jgi:hypothetical protein
MDVFSVQEEFLEPAFNRRFEGFQLKRLYEIILGAKFQHGDCVFDGWVAGHKDHDRIGLMLEA